MSELIPASGTVHWIGVGLSTGSGVRVVCDLADRVVVWARTERKAQDRISKLGLSGRARGAAFSLDLLANTLQAGDIVVSMLPAAEHAGLLRLCLRHGAHFACSSYVSEPILAQAPAAERAGVVVLTEAGLDPGIDHLFAHRLVAQGRAVIGNASAVAEFTSYCGGIPAVPNEFRYQFSWAPRGVLSALCQPAQYIEDGKPKSVIHPWEAVRPLALNGEIFEVYPNRDSLPFISQYTMPPTWRFATFVRGTLRSQGWSSAWADVFAELLADDKERIDRLANDLAIRYPTTDSDFDRVVLAVALRLRANDGREWSGQYLIDLRGDESESAMARCVSLPLSFGIAQILASEMPAGLHRAAEDPDEARRWLRFLEKHGISCELSMA